jgi:hypothetical protein
MKRNKVRITKKFKYLLLHNRLIETIRKPFGWFKSKLQILNYYLSGRNEEQEDKYSILLYWLGEVMGYGLLVNIPLTVLFNRKFTVFTVFSYGVVWYLVKIYRGK